MNFHYPQKKFSIQENDEGITLVGEASTLGLGKTPAEVWVESDKTGVEIRFEHISTFRQEGEIIYCGYSAPAVDNLHLIIFND